MKQFQIKPAAARYLLLVTMSVTLFSFSARMGGDSFEIYLNGKMAIQQYVAMKQGVKNLQLDQTSYNEDLIVYYSHCGKTGTDRALILKDGQNRALKVWHFPNDPAARSAMNCKVKEMLDVQKNNSGGSLSLYYSSREIPEGRLLAAIIVSNDNKTVLKQKTRP